MASNDAASVLEDYKSSLDDLTFNSKPMINVLTMLAEENEVHADGIVRVIRNRIKGVDIKLKIPSLYLLDSILKNVGGDFIGIIAKYMTEIFTDVFEHGDEKVRLSMFKLRNTWPQYFPSKFLHDLDLNVKELDPNWPVAELQASAASIHVNPKFLIKNEEVEHHAADDPVTVGKLKSQQQEERLRAEEKRIQEQLKKLQEEQLKLQQARLEEERRKHEGFLKKQQAERERLLAEQQRQIIELKKQQELMNAHADTGSHKMQKQLHSPLKTQLDSNRNIDPRLGKKLAAVGSVAQERVLTANSDGLKIDQNLATEGEIMSEVTRIRASTKTALSLDRQDDTHQHLRLSEKLSDNLQTKKEVPRLKTSDANNSGQICMQKNLETNIGAADRDISNGDHRKKKRILETDEKIDSADQNMHDGINDKTFGDECGLPDKQPPVKKKKSDELPESTDAHESTMEVENDQGATSTDMMQTSADASENVSGKENRDVMSTELPEGDLRSKFRRPNRSEWRKLMIEKAKLERRQRIPSEKELPREMRMENHEELLQKLKVRLENGEINSAEYETLRKQLDIMYEVQRSRESLEQRRNLAEKRWGRGDTSEAKNTGNEDRTGAKIMPGTAARSSEIVEKTNSRALSQKETNKDLIRQLREKRLNVEREQRESERRLDRERNREQYRPSREKREPPDHRYRKEEADRDSRRDKDQEYDWRDRRRQRMTGRGRWAGRRPSYQDRPRSNEEQSRDRRKESPSELRRRESPIEDRRKGSPSLDRRKDPPFEDKRKDPPENRRKEPRLEDRTDPPSQDKRREPPVQDRRAGLPVKDRRTDLPSQEKRKEPPIQEKRTEPPAKDRRRESPSKDKRREPPSENRRDITKLSDGSQSAVDNEHDTSTRESKSQPLKDKNKQTDTKCLEVKTDVELKSKEDEKFLDPVETSTRAVEENSIGEASVEENIAKSTREGKDACDIPAVKQNNPVDQDMKEDTARVPDNIGPGSVCTEQEPVGDHAIRDSPIKTFKIPKKERPRIEERAESQPRAILHDEDIRKLSWRANQDTDIAEQSEQIRDDPGQGSDVRLSRGHQGGRQMQPAEDNRAFRNAAPFDDRQKYMDRPRNERLPLDAEGRPLSWREDRPHFDEYYNADNWREDERFHQRPDFERLPGSNERMHPPNCPDSDTRPPIIDNQRQGMPRDFSRNQRRYDPENHGMPDRAFEPMHPRMRMRPPFHQRGPEFEEQFAPRFRGPRPRSSRYWGPRQRGGPWVRGRRDDGFGPGGPENMDRGFEAEMNFRVPPFHDREWEPPEMRRDGFLPHEDDAHRFIPKRSPPPSDERSFEEPPRFNDRGPRQPMDRPGFDRMDNRYNEREPRFHKYNDPSFQPPFHEETFDRRFNDQPRFQDDRRFPHEPDRFDQRSRDYPDFDDRIYRGGFDAGPRFDEFPPRPREYEDRRPSPVPYQHGIEKGPDNAPAPMSIDETSNESPQYKDLPETANFVTSNPLLQMIQNVKAMSGEPGNRTPDSQTDSLPDQQQASQSFMGVKELFHKLVSTGVIPTSNVSESDVRSATPPPKLDTSGENIPEIKFVMDDLKKRYAGVINSLYVGSQCSSCGLRFPEKDKQLYRDHLDWHFRVNRREKENKKSVSRPWFYSVEQWLDMDDVVDFEESAKSNIFETEAKSSAQQIETEDGSCSVLGGDEDSVCDICFESFEQFWDEPLEEWRYKDAVRINGRTYHMTCYNDADVGEYASGSDPELLSEDNKLSPLIGKLPFLETVKQENPPQLGTIDENVNLVPKVENDSAIAGEPVGGTENLYSEFGVIVKKEPEDNEFENELAPDSPRVMNDCETSKTDGLDNTSIVKNEELGEDDNEPASCVMKVKESGNEKICDQKPKDDFIVDGTSVEPKKEVTTVFTESSDGMCYNSEELALYSSEMQLDHGVDETNEPHADENSEQSIVTHEGESSEPPVKENDEVKEVIEDISSVAEDAKREKLLDVEVEDETNEKGHFNLMSGCSDQVIDKSVLVDKEMKNFNKTVEFEGNPQS